MTTPAIQMKLSAREFNPRGEAIAAKVNELQAAGENRAQISLLNKSGAARVHNDKVAMNAKYMKKAENALRSIKVENVSPAAVPLRRDLFLVLSAVKSGKLTCIRSET